jgi:hypothetical protein
MAIDSCFVTCPTTTTTIPVQEKDGWYDTGETRCNLNGNLCGYGTKEMKQEYRDYTCFGSTCTYVVTQTRWMAIDSCFVTCPTTTTTIPVQEKDGWYDTGETRCNLNGNLCGYGTKEMKQEYRDYTCFGSTCTYVVTQTRWMAIDSCFVTCPTTTTTIPVQEKDGWYDTGETRCNLNGNLCGYGTKEMKQEYRDYTCFGSTCTYVVTQTRWMAIDSCFVTCPTTTTTIPVQEKDGWYDTGEEKCEMNGLECGYGTKMKEQEYRDYTCFGVTCTYVVTARRWIEAGTCYQACPSGYSCVNGYCKLAFDCNSLDGWYSTGEERCSSTYECGIGEKQVKEEYRDYYPIVSNPTSSSDCSFVVKDVRWNTIGSCYLSCSNGYYCDNGFCKLIPKNCEVKIWVREENTNLPIGNANVCLNSKCYLTDSNGFASFYVNVGSYSLKISKYGYETKLVTITCEDCGNPIYQTVTIQKIKTYFDCNILDGWYYTNESYCDMGGFECGKGLIMKKQEYRDYYGLADSSLQCTNYKVVAYRWVDDGYCQKNCINGICEEGFCKQPIKLQDVNLAPTYQEYEHPKPEENRIDFWILVVCLTAFLLILLLFMKKRRSEQEDCCY